MRTKKEAIGRLLKVASNQMSREFDNFAAQLDLTGQQMSILDFLGNQSEEDSGKEISQTMIELEFNIRRSTTTEILQLFVAPSVGADLGLPSSSAMVVLEEGRPRSPPTRFPERLRRSCRGGCPIRWPCRRTRRPRPAPLPK